MSTIYQTKSHTPGPWRIGDFRFDVIAGEYQRVATVAHDLQGLNRGEEISQANARLISAAPELLQLLRELYTALPMSKDNEQLIHRCITLIGQIDGEQR